MKAGTTQEKYKSMFLNLSVFYYNRSHINAWYVSDPKLRKVDDDEIRSVANGAVVNFNNFNPFLITHTGEPNHYLIQRRHALAFTLFFVAEVVTVAPRKV
jgi:hypothetical protein